MSQDRKEGNPSQKLSDMLKYIEKTTNNNVTGSPQMQAVGKPSRQSPNVHASMPTWLVARGNQGIESIQQLVERVKRKKEVGINYMKSWEVEKMVREEGYAEGYDSGYDSGYGSGYDGGYSKGYDTGQDRVNLLNARLSKAGRTDDIVKAAQDKAYQESLFEEFHL